MRIEDSLQRLRKSLTPSGSDKDRIRERLMQRIDASPAFARAKEAATPSRALQERIWQRVLERIEPRAVSSLLGKLRDMLNPEPGSLGMIPRFAPVPVRSRSQRAFKWAAAALVLIVMVRMTPLLFLAAPRSSAESAVLVVPTRGTLSISMRGLWEPVKGELQLKEGASFRTEDGEATFTFNDDGNIRLDENTEIIIHDVSDRPEPALGGPTISVLHGRVWVQGYVPDHIRGIVISTSQGDIDLHEGSVAISVGETVDVRVWDRHARVNRSGVERDLLLVAGERVDLWDDNAAMVKKVATKEYEEFWPSQNLAKDAVHRREIAMLQRERTAARAGILPTSPFYSVKRVAEAVDVMLTFDEKQKVEKQLQQASMRLDEAAAILAGGGTGTTAQIALNEYKMALLSVSGSGDAVTQFLVRQQVVEDTAQLAAALPDDVLYAVKKAVLEASAGLPGPLVDAQNIEGVVFLDTLDIVSEAVEAGDIPRAKEAFANAQLYLQALTNSSGTSLLSPDVHKEAISLLSTLAVTLSQQSGSGDTIASDDLLKAVSTYLPVTTPAHVAITEAEAERITQRIHDRVFIFKQSRSRWSQLMYEIKQLEGNPDEGTLLRHLYRKMPENGLAGPVRTRIVELGKQKAGGR